MAEEHILKLRASDYIEEALCATSCLPDNFNTLPIIEYICSAIFLKITGLLEQKFKAISWIMADNDREYRRNLLSSKQGECSQYKDKQQIYKNLVETIEHINKTAFIRNPAILAEKSKSLIENLFENTIFRSNLYIEFKTFQAVISDITFTQQTKNCELLPETNIKNVFDKIIEQRNRCAHNLYVNSFVQHDIKSLYSQQGLNSDNVFIQFFVLIYLDEIFNYTYLEYKKALANL